MARRARGGRIEVSWHLQVQDAEPWLGLHWCERHADVEGWEMPRQRGLGRALIEQRVPYELAGSGELRFDSQGLDAWIRFRCASATAADRCPGGGIIGLKGDLSPIWPNWV